MESKNSRQARSYHVSPARRWIMAWVFAPFLLMSIGILFTDERGAAIALMFIVLPIVGFGHWLVSYARLILSPEGVIWRQLGCRMETTWDNITAVRLDRGREGFVGKEPLSGPGVKRMAAARGIGMKGIPLYDEEQRAALAKGVFMPLDPFAYAIRNGTMLSDLDAWAPDVAAKIRAELERAAQCEGERKRMPRTPKDRRARWLVGTVVAGALALAIGSSMLGTTAAHRVTHGVSALVFSVSALSAFYSCRSAFRNRARLMGVLFFLLGIILAVLGVILWGRVFDS